MRCYFCGKTVDNKESHHTSCLRKLFGVDYLPTIDLSLGEVNIKAQQMAGKLSISGVQPKLSVKLNKGKKQLEVVPEGGEYILKPQTNTFINIPENENLCMTIAGNLGIETPAHSLIKLKDDTWAYVVKRFDREKKVKKHQEDFCQILEVREEMKYSGSVEEIAKKLSIISEVPGLDLQLFFERLLFFFIIGNGDAHLKNFSIIYSREGSIRLAPVYDIVSSRLAMLNEKEEFAIPINGRKNNIRRKDFDLFANSFEINSKICYENIMRKDLIDELISESQLPEYQKKKLKEVVKIRLSRISK
jgi:serine/threonine-protein kinase HipA